MGDDPGDLDLLGKGSSRRIELIQAAELLAEDGDLFGEVNGLHLFGVVSNGRGTGKGGLIIRKNLTEVGNPRQV